MPDVCQIPIRKDRSLLAKVCLLDRANNFVYWIDTLAARRLISCGEIEALRTPRGRIRAVRWISPERMGVDPRKTYIIRRRGYGDSHLREHYLFKREWSKMASKV